MLKLDGLTAGKIKNSFLLFPFQRYLDILMIGRCVGVCRVTLREGPNRSQRLGWGGSTLTALANLGLAGRRGSSSEITITSVF